MEITEINDNITSNVGKEVKKAVRQMGKTGYINADGNIYKYIPRTSTFQPVDPNQTVQKFYDFYTPRWDVVSDVRILETIKANLPAISVSDIEEFNLYCRFAQIPVNENFIDKAIKTALEDNNSYKNIEADFTGKYDIASQLLILRNNDVFSNNMFLFQYSDGSFNRLSNEDILNIFIKEMGNSNKELTLLFVKKNFKLYLRELTQCAELLNQSIEKDKKYRIMKENQKGFDKVMKIVSKYQ